MLSAVLGGMRIIISEGQLCRLARKDHDLIRSKFFTKRRLELEELLLYIDKLKILREFAEYDWQLSAADYMINMHVSL